MRGEGVGNEQEGGRVWEKKIERAARRRGKERGWGGKMGREKRWDKGDAVMGKWKDLLAGIKWMNEGKQRRKEVDGTS